MVKMFPSPLLFFDIGLRPKAVQISNLSFGSSWIFNKSGTSKSFTRYPISFISGMELRSEKGYNTNPVYIEFLRKGEWLRHINMY